jgi:hypothetical protein
MILAVSFQKPEIEIRTNRKKPPIQWNASKQDQYLMVADRLERIVL